MTGNRHPFSFTDSAAVFPLISAPRVLQSGLRGDKMCRFVATLGQLNLAATMKLSRSFNFTHALCRQPGKSVRHGIRAGASSAPDPDPVRFADQHRAYVTALRNCGVNVAVLTALEAFPDSVFVEDPALVVENTAILLRPGAPSRRGEASATRVELIDHIDQVVTLPGNGHIDGGDILLTDTEALVGQSQRTSAAAIGALAEVLQDFDYQTRPVQTPDEILHFKSDCGLLDANTVFATSRLARTGAFDDYTVIETPADEQGAANIVRINDYVLLSEGYPGSKRLLQEAGYQVLTLDTSEAMRIDGGLSCMSLRFSKAALCRTVD